jgi:IS66 Orf2 like protein
MLFDFVREVFVAQHRVDFRMGIFGLRAEMNKMLLDPYKGDCCVFIHPSHRQIKIVAASESGCFLVVKFFEAGAMKHKLRFLFEPSFVQISRAELAMLCEGANFAQVEKAPAWVTCEKKKEKVTRDGKTSTESGEVHFGSFSHKRNTSSGARLA